MTIQALRYAHKVVSLDGGTVVEFPRYFYEFQPGGDLRPADSELPSLSFGFDHLRNAISPRKITRSAVRFMIGEDTPILSDAYIDSLRSTLLNMGPFWLYTIGADGTERRARCRLERLPDVLVSYQRSITAPAMVEFRRYSDWLSPNQEQHVQVISATPTLFTVTNPGGLAVDEVEVRFRVNPGGSFSNPTLINQTNGYTFQSNRDAAAADDELKLDTGEPSVLWSTDDGGNYTNDITNLVIPTTQIPLAFVLDPGPNSLRYENNGAPGGLNVEIRWYPRWA